MSTDSDSCLRINWRRESMIFPDLKLFNRMYFFSISSYFSKFIFSYIFSYKFLRQKFQICVIFRRLHFHPTICPMCHTTWNGASSVHLSGGPPTSSRIRSWVESARRRIHLHLSPLLPVWFGFFWRYLWNNCHRYRQI